MINEWIQTIWKNNTIKKIENSKNQSEIAECEQKPPEKANFCSKNAFLLYFKNRAEKNSRHKTTGFLASLPVSAWPKSLPNLTSKIMKMCEDLKKT